MRTTFSDVRFTIRPRSRAPSTTGAASIVNCSPRIRPAPRTSSITGSSPQASKNACQSRRGAFLSDRSTIAPPGEARFEQLAEELPETARQSSEMERRADEAERELLQWKKVRFMSDKVGDEYEGFVTGVAPFGLFVELVEHYVEGRVHVSSMADDYYRFVEQQHALYGENTKKTYRLGAKVRVQVVRVDLERRQIDLGLVEILDAVREEGRPRQVRSRVKPKIERRTRPGRRERADRKGKRR